MYFMDSLLVVAIISICLVRTTMGFYTKCPNDCFCTFIEITVDCQNADLTNLPVGLHLETTRLDLSFNKFTTIPGNLSVLKELEILNLSNNYVSAIGENSFDNLEKLKVLDLSNNLFDDWRALHYNCLVSLKSLKHLDLSHNSLRGFPEIAEYPLRSDTLKTFILSNCSITNVQGDILAGMVNVEKLILSNNPLTSLNAQLRSEKLKYLDFSNCDLQRISVDVILELTSLETLIVSNNWRLKKFNAKSKSLNTLNLNNCSIDTYPTNSLYNLSKIYLQNNQVKYLQENIFKSTPSIEVLILSHNSISSIEEGAFYGLDYVEILDLSYNTISRIESETFSENKKLLHLSLSHNYLSKVDRIVSNSLKLLDVSACEIRSVDKNSLTLMMTLEELNLSRNLISLLPDNWIAYKLRSLDLSTNRLFTLTNATFSRMPFLRNLNLAGNRLTASIKPSYFHDIDTVRLDDNSWLCACKDENFRNLYDWLINKMHSNTELRCMFPENLAGLPWEVACQDYWYIQASRSDRVWVFSVVLIVGTITLICVVFSIRRAYQLKEYHERELAERDRVEVRERLRRMQEQQFQIREDEERNAPDPRELQRPPSYAEAILLPRIDGSYSSLAGSQFSLSASQRNLSGSRRSLRGSQNDIAEGKVRKKRRRSRPKVKDDGNGDGQSSERLNTEEATSDSETIRYNLDNSNNSNSNSNSNSARPSRIIESDL